MRLPSSSVAALACGAVFLLSACSEGTSTPAAVGAASNLTHGAIPADLAPAQRLAVSTFQSVVVLNSSYDVVQTITNGVKAATGDYYDAKGNLYVADTAGPNVTEYNTKGTLTFTYSTGLSDPSGVTVDHRGNVYVSDWNDDEAGVIVEYAQGSNTPLVSCSTGYANADMVVDNKGDVFLSADVPNGSKGGEILEYKGGLSGCNATTLSVALHNVVGLLLDKHGNLVACEPAVGVAIIPPPYTAIGKTITGLSDPLRASFNKKQNVIYIANNAYGDPTVAVDKYPSGSNIATLGASNGITYAAEGAAAYR
jgi:hypothetical protein